MRSNQPTIASIAWKIAAEQVLALASVTNHILVFLHPDPIGIVFTQSRTDELKSLFSMRKFRGVVRL